MIKDNKYKVEFLQRKLTHQGRDWAIYTAPIQAVQSIGLSKEFSRYAKTQTQGISLENALRDAYRVCAVQVAYGHKKEDKFWEEMSNLLNLREGSKVKEFYSWLNTKKALEIVRYRKF